IFAISRNCGRLLAGAILGVLLAGCGATSQPAQPASGALPPARPEQFVLVRDPLGNSELWLQTLHAAPGQMLADRLTHPACSAGTTLIYTVATTASSQLVRHDLDSTTVRTLVNDPEASLTQAECSPRHDRVLYLRRPSELVDDEPQPPRIWRTTAPAQGVPAVPEVFSGRPALNAQWSPDGSAVIFELAETPNLVLIDPSSNQHQLPFIGTFTWSPDSGSIVVSQLTDAAAGRFARLVRYDIASGQSTTLLDAPDSDVYYPRWSPDGTQIAFVRRPLGAEHGELWVLPLADLTAARQISDDQQYDNFDPQWSPDSQSLLWSRFLPQQERYSIWHTPLDASSPTQVADDAIWPRWLRQ
ncbi:MAG: PD40 domain-containing protein, partial [Herpetosiphonaceae bacterium]|nr:PD40 domain-containing protein [Herpetosiphonaceae bacterium]